MHTGLSCQTRVVYERADTFSGGLPISMNAWSKNAGVAYEMLSEFQKQPESKGVQSKQWHDSVILGTGFASKHKIVTHYMRSIVLKVLV